MRKGLRKADAVLQGRLARKPEKESGSAAKFALSMLLENAETAETEHLAVCQDTGMAVFYAK